MLVKNGAVVDARYRKQYTTLKEAIDLEDAIPVKELMASGASLKLLPGWQLKSEMKNEELKKAIEEGQKAFERRRADTGKL